MKFNVGCLRRPLVGPAIVMSLLSACATESSEPVVGTCPPVVVYYARFQASVAEEVQTLPNASAVLEMLRDYSGMREQARGCVYP